MPADRIVLRYLCRDRILHALPMRVVEWGPRRIALWISSQTVCRRPPRKLTFEERASGRWPLVERPWSEDVGTLLLHEFGRAHSIWLFWRDDGSFTGWYVNLERPWRPTPVGFDTHDEVLDVMIDVDGGWRWQDEDELEEAKAVGLLDDEDGARIRREGERVIAEWPFPTGWEEWRPDPGWPLCELPNGWDCPPARF